MAFTDDEIQRAWEKGLTEGIPIDQITIWRKDVCGAWITRDEYGEESEFGWQVDHAYPESKGGDKSNDNLRAMHWENNNKKSDDFPEYTCAVTSNGDDNVETNKRLIVGDAEILRQRYEE